MLVGGSAGPAWLGVAGAAAVFSAVAVHLWVLAAELRRALPARFAVTVHYYLAACVAALAGIPAGAWLLLLDDDQRPRLLLFHAVPAVATARQRPPASFATWPIGAGLGWLLVALTWDMVSLLSAHSAATAADRFDAILVPLGGGFVAQVLLGALSYLLPMTLGGGPALVRERTARLDAHWSQRLTMTNVGLAVFLLPVPPFVRTTAALLVLAALIQFLLPAVRVLLSRTRTT